MESTIKFFINEKDKRVLKSAAKHHGLSLSAWMRLGLLKLAREEKGKHK